MKNLFKRIWYFPVWIFINLSYWEWTPVNELEFISKNDSKIGFFNFLYWIIIISILTIVLFTWAHK